MRKEAFKVMHGIEDSWWYKGRAWVVQNVLNSFLSKNRKEQVLDFGSGFGGMYEYLKKYGDISAMELQIDARESCKTRGYVSTFSSSSEAFSSRGFSVVGMFDVLEHIEDDKKILNDIYNNLVEGGLVVITVPAYKFLWSIHDVEHHHYRRYTRSTLKRLLEDTGFKVKYSSYWNTILFLPIAFLRLLGVGGGESLSKPSVFDKIFKAILYFETRFIPKLSYLFGTGIVLIGAKITSDE